MNIITSNSSSSLSLKGKFTRKLHKSVNAWRIIIIVVEKNTKKKNMFIYWFIYHPRIAAPTYVDFLLSILFFFIKGKRWYLNGILNAVQTGFLSFMELIDIETDVLAWLGSYVTHMYYITFIIFRCVQFIWLSFRIPIWNSIII